jgi:hypothetical protein
MGHHRSTIIGAVVVMTTPLADSGTLAIAGSLPSEPRAVLVSTAPLSLRVDLAAPVQETPDQETTSPADDDVIVEWLEPPAPYAARGTKRWHVTGGAAWSFSTRSDSLAMLGVGVSSFVADGLSFDIDFSGLDIRQAGSDTWGINLTMSFRLHFLREPSWTMYLDGGCGLMYSGDQVPEDGTVFNLTPQFGVGFSIAVADDVRLLTGVRWFHISNANTDADNPGRDSLLLYAGLSFPF